MNMARERISSIISRLTQGADFIAPVIERLDNLSTLPIMKMKDFMSITFYQTRDR